MIGLWIIPKQLPTSVSALDTKALDLDYEEFSQICEKSLTWRGKDSPSRTWLLRCKRESWMQHLCSLTLKPSHTESFVDSWTSYLAASRANPSVLLESVKALKTHDTCSLTSEMESHSADLDLFSWRTSKESSPVKQQTENQFSSMSSESWKAWVTEQRQEYSARVKSGPLIKGNGCSSWATPEAANQVGYQVSKGKKFPRLGSQVTNWPTTRASNPGSRPNGKGGKILAEEAKNWVTPNARDWKDTPGQSKKRPDGTSRLDQLPRQVFNSTSGSNHVLNPNWVEQLMGLPVGWTDLDSLVTE